MNKCKRGYGVIAELSLGRFASRGTIPPIDVNVYSWSRPLGGTTPLSLRIRVCQNSYRLKIYMSRG